MTSDEIGVDLGLLGKDFSETEVDLSEPKRVVLIGEVINSGIRIAHYNDEDLTGGLTRIGWPKDDDLGRTAGLQLKFFFEGEDGTIEVNLENWLFSKPSGDITVENGQIVEEYSTIELRSRKFQDPDGKEYLIFGFEFHHTMKDQFIMGFLQDFLHGAGFGRTRTSQGRDGGDVWANVLFGKGGRFDIMKKKAMNLYLTYEGEVAASTDFSEETRGTVRTSLNTSLGYYKGTKIPIMRIKAYAEYSLFINGEQEYEIGLEMFINVLLKGFQVELGTGVAYFDTRYDRQYEGNQSYNTSLFIRVRTPKKREVPTYIEF